MEVHVPSSALRPIHYDLRIDPYIDEARFDGSVTIKVHALEATPSIALNAHNILIHDTKLKDQDGIPIMISDASTNTSLQTFSIVLELPLPADCYVYLSLDFSGPLDRSGTGIFITDVLSSSPMLSTLFEPMQARTVFPCFDEPCFKATFSLSIDVPTGLKCLGNTFIKSEGPVTPIRKRRIVFDKTPPLPTYLLAFAIGDFDMIESNEFRIPIRAYVPWTYDIKHCRHLLEIAAKVLAIYETMFGIDCGLTKLDFLAVPASVAAMENWGLITISTAVAFISSDSSVTEKLRTAQLVAHEIAHQWFGNIVTIESWDNYWLKEALADWAEVSAMEQLSNSEPWREFVAETMQDALWLDSSQFSHPLVAPIEAGKDVYLDDIIYGKGCAVLRMLAGFVGKDVFLDGIRRLLRQNIHSNGCPEDLWDIFSNLSGVDIGKLMKSWTETTGHPSVIVEENEAEGTITLTQQRLCLSGAEDSTLYSIPLAVRTGTGVVTELLDERCKTIKVTFDFYKINAGEVGFYRVAYPKSRLQKLAGEARKGTLSVEDRIALVADTAALAFGGHPSVTTADLLNLLQDFREEQNFFVWWTITATLKNFSRRLLFEDDAVRTAFALYQKNLVRKCLDRLSNMQPSDDNGGRFRALVLMSSGGNETVVALTKALFTQYVSGEEQPITPNIRAEVFEVVLKRGSKKEVNCFT